MSTRHTLVGLVATALGCFITGTVFAEPPASGAAPPSSPSPPPAEPTAAPPAAAPPAAAPPTYAVPPGYMLVPIPRSDGQTRYDVQYPQGRGALPPGMELPYEAGDPIPPGYRLFEQRWRSFQAGWLRPVDFTPISGKRPTGRPRQPEAPVSIPAVDVTGALLSEIERSCETQGARLVVLLIPGHWQVRPALRGFGSFAAQRDAYAAARTLCLDRRLRALDTYPALAASEERGVAVYNPTDMHWNAAGHGLAAGLLADALRGGQP